MKTRWVILWGVSIVLAIVFSRLFFSGSASPRAEVAVMAVDRPEPNRNEHAPEISSLPLTWTSIYSTNLSAYISNLRALRCPEGTVRTLALAEINKSYAAEERKARAILRGPKSTSSASLKDRLDARLQLLTIQQQKRTLAYQLFGTAIEELDSEELGLESRVGWALDGIPQAKRARVTFLSDWFDAQVQTLSEKPFSFGDDRKALADLESGRQKAASDCSRP